MSKRIILHLCTDIGSDSRFYDLDDRYEVIKVGKEAGVENFAPPPDVHGVIANPVCTDFSTANYSLNRDVDRGLFLVNHCLRIVDGAQPAWWVV